MVSIWPYVSANVPLNSSIYTTFTILCIFEVNVCLIVRFPSSEERKCSTFHKGTQSLQEKTLKPGGHGSACSVNRSSSFFHQDVLLNTHSAITSALQFKPCSRLVSA